MKIMQARYQLHCLFSSEASYHRTSQQKGNYAAIFADTVVVLLFTSCPSFVELKGIVHPINENSVIIYQLSCYLKVLGPQNTDEVSQENGVAESPKELK